MPMELVPEGSPLSPAETERFVQGAFADAPSSARNGVSWAVTADKRWYVAVGVRSETSGRVQWQVETYLKGTGKHDLGAGASGKVFW